MKKVIYLASLVSALSLYSCQEVKNDAAQVEEGVKEAGEDLTDEPAKKVGEGFEDAGEALTNEPLKEVGEGFEDAGKGMEKEAEKITE